MTPLWISVNRGRTDVVRLLLEKGADFESKNSRSSEMTPLAVAAQKVHVEMVKIPLDYSASLNCKDWYGRTPLHSAAMYWHAPVVELLLEKVATRSLKISEVGHYYGGRTGYGI